MGEVTRESSKQELPIAIFLLLVALAARFLVPPWTHYTFNDEYYYLRSAYELRTTGVIPLENQPPFLIWLYALAFLVFPATAHTTSAVSAVLGGLTAPVLYATLRALSVDRVVAGLSALLLAIHPLHLKHSGATSLEVVSVLTIVATVGTFAHWMTRASFGSLLAFATCLFAALTTRIENFALVPILGAAAFVYEHRAPRVSRTHLVALAIVVGVAASYLPKILSFHGSQPGWWVSELPPVSLLLNNLAFWIGGNLTIGKLPFLLLAAGVVGAWRNQRDACLTWLALFVTYSLVYVVHGTNLGYHEEPGQHPFLASRAGGHDMFRFNVPLLPAIVFFTASGIVTWLRWIEAALVRIPDRMRTATSMAVLLVVALLLLGWGDAYRAFDPAGFLRSPYNRAIEQTEYEMLETHLQDAPRPTRCYVLSSPTEPWLGEGIEIVTVHDPADVAIGVGSAFFLLSSVQLAKPEMKELAEKIAARFVVEPVAAGSTGPVDLRLFRLEPRPRH